MKHQKKQNKLGRTASHRKAMLSNMAISLITYKRIETTVSKAKALRPYVEPLITTARKDTTHSRRLVFSQLQNKDAVSVLFRDIIEKVGDRPGGYTRILKTGNRLGDNASMCIIELVDYNESMLSVDKTPSQKRRTRRRTKSNLVDNHVNVVESEEGISDTETEHAESNMVKDDMTRIKEKTLLEYDMEPVTKPIAPFTLDVQAYLNREIDSNLYTNKDYELNVDIDLQDEFNRDFLKREFIAILKSNKIEILGESLKEVEFDEKNVSNFKFFIRAREVGSESMELLLLQNLVPIKKFPISINVIQPK